MADITTGLLANITTTMDILPTITTIWTEMVFWIAHTILMTGLWKIPAVVLEVPVEMPE